MRCKKINKNKSVINNTHRKKSTIYKNKTITTKLKTKYLQHSVITFSSELQEEPDKTFLNCIQKSSNIKSALQ